MTSFLQRFGSYITGVLSGLDRIRFRGILQPIIHATGLERWLTQQSVPLKDFGPWAQQQTEQLRQAVEAAATAAGRPVVYLSSGRGSKEQIVRTRLERDGVGPQGLIGVWSTLETCSAFDLYRNAQTHRLDLRYRPHKCLHYYFYYQDRRFGLGYVRLQTWLPFDVRVYLNGREWLCRQLDAAGLAYVRHDNCLTAVEDFDHAQRLLDRQLRINWVKHLDGLVQRASPWLAQFWAKGDLRPYWTVEQSEWATDLVFRQPADLQALYPQLLRYGLDHFASPDVMRFLGRKVPAEGMPARFQGEVVTDLAERPEGLRIKHRLNRNALKMYDKQGQVLRVETTLNSNEGLKSFRAAEGDPKGPKQWRPLRKSVADLPRRAELSQAANSRYLEALAAVEPATPLASYVDRLCRPVAYQGRRVRALNPFAPEDARLLALVTRGEFLISGFRNRDLRRLFFDGEASDPAARRRQAAKISRLLRLLRAHGLIKRIPRTHRYLLTAEGQVAIPALQAARQASVEKLTRAA